VVLTRNPGFRPPQDVAVAPDLEAALNLVAGAPRVFVVGGASVYRDALPRAHELLVTRIHARVPGDVRFPPVAWDDWTLAEEERHPADARHAFPFSFRRYTRRG
jgi:dihydrofolate reductase